MNQRLRGLVSALAILFFLSSCRTVQDTAANMNLANYSQETLREATNQALQVSWKRAEKNLALEGSVMQVVGRSLKWPAQQDSMWKTLREDYAKAKDLDILLAEANVLAEQSLHASLKNVQTLAVAYQAKQSLQLLEGQKDAISRDFFLKNEIGIKKAFVKGFASLAKAKQWERAVLALVKLYNATPYLPKKTNFNPRQFLADHLYQVSLQACMEQEAKIRAQEAMRSTPLLKKVFYHYQEN